MSDEYEYVPFGSEWDDEDQWWLTNDAPQQDLLFECFTVTGRRSKRWSKKSEASRWRKICNKLTNGTLRENWVKHMILWAQNKNRIARGSITLWSLFSAILNMANYDKWLAKNPEEATEAIQDLEEEQTDDY